MDELALYLIRGGNPCMFVLPVCATVWRNVINERQRFFTKHTLARDKR